MQVLQNKDRIAQLGAGVLLIAYDQPSLLSAKILRGLEVPYELLVDIEKRTYRQWGMGRTTPLKSFLPPSLAWRYLKLLARGERFLGIAPDMLQLGGDFVVDAGGRIAFGHAMRNNGDRVAVSELLRVLSSAAEGPGGGPWQAT